MFFNRELLVDGSLKDAWRIAHRDNTLEADDEASLQEMCEELRSRIDRDDHRDRRMCLSLRTAAFLTSGVSRLYRRKVQMAYEDLFKLNTDVSLTSDESDDGNEEDKIKRETSLLSLRKRRRPTTSDELEIIRHYITDEDGSSHSSPKIRSRDSLSNGTKQLSQITDNHSDKSSTDGEEETVDDDEEVVDDEVASSDRNVADNSNESRSVRSHINEQSSVWTTSEAVPKHEGQQNNTELQCIGNESHVDDVRVEGVDSHHKLPMAIDDVGQLTTVRDTHEEVPGCTQSVNGNHASSVAKTNNEQPTGAAQEKQKSQMTQTVLSSFNRLQGEISEDSEDVNFHRNLPFGCLIVYDSYNSRVPSQIILSSLNENVRKLKKH